MFIIAEFVQLRGVKIDIQPAADIRRGCSLVTVALLSVVFGDLIDANRVIVYPNVCYCAVVTVTDFAVSHESADLNRHLGWQVQLVGFGENLLAIQEQAHCAFTIGQTAARENGDDMVPLAQFGLSRPSGRVCRRLSMLLSLCRSKAQRPYPLDPSPAATRRRCLPRSDMSRIPRTKRGSFRDPLLNDLSQTSASDPPKMTADAP